MGVVFFMYRIIFIIKNTMNYRKKFYTKEECKEIFAKCKNRTEFRSRHYGAYRQCEENGWLEEICPSFFLSKASKIFFKLEISFSSNLEAIKIKDIFFIPEPRI